MRARRLKRLKIRRVDLVARGANPGATVALFKSDTSTRPTPLTWQAKAAVAKTPTPSTETKKGTDMAETRHSTLADVQLEKLREAQDWEKHRAVSYGNAADIAEGARVDHIRNGFDSAFLPVAEEIGKRDGSPAHVVALKLLAASPELAEARLAACRGHRRPEVVQKLFKAYRIASAARDGAAMASVRKAFE